MASEVDDDIFELNLCFREFLKHLHNTATATYSNIKCDFVAIYCNDLLFFVNSDATSMTPEGARQ